MAAHLGRVALDAGAAFGEGAAGAWAVDAGATAAGDSELNRASDSSSWLIWPCSRRNVACSESTLACRSGQGAGCCARTMVGAKAVITNSPSSLIRPPEKAK